MTVATVTKNEWTLVVTATSDTLIENLGHREVYILKEEPTLSNTSNARRLSFTILTTGEPAYIYSSNRDTSIKYLVIGV